MDTTDVPRCRLCGGSLEMVHGAGVCLDVACTLHGVVQEDCCTGAPEPTDEGEIPTAPSGPAPIPWSPRTRD